MIKVISGISYSGKTTFKKLLENDKFYKKKYLIFDLDEEIENDLGLKISSYIRKFNINTFRQREFITIFNILKKYKGNNNLIIFLGGGFLTNTNNQMLILKNKDIKLYHLLISYETYLERLEKFRENNKILANKTYEFYLSRTTINENLNPKIIRIDTIKNNDILSSYKIFKEELDL